MGTNLDKNYEDIIISKGPIHFPKPIGFIHHTLLSPVVDILIIPLPLFDIVAFLLAWIAVSEAL